MVAALTVLARADARPHVGAVGARARGRDARPALELRDASLVIDRDGGVAVHGRREAAARVRDHREVGVAARARADRVAALPVADRRDALLLPRAARLGGLRGGGRRARELGGALRRDPGVVVAELALAGAGADPVGLHLDHADGRRNRGGLLRLREADGGGEQRGGAGEERDEAGGLVDVAGVLHDSCSNFRHGLPSPAYGGSGWVQDARNRGL